MKCNKCGIEFEGQDKCPNCGFPAGAIYNISNLQGHLNNQPQTGTNTVKNGLKNWHIVLIVISSILVMSVIGTTLSHNINYTPVNVNTLNTNEFVDTTSKTIESSTITSIPNTSEHSTTAIKKEKQIKVLNVVGLTADEAKKVLEKAGFTNLVFEADETGESKHILKKSNWTVTKQYPLEFTEISPNDKIILTCKKTTEIEKEELNEISERFRKLIDKPVTDAMAEVENSGYIATYFDDDSNTNYTNKLSEYSKNELKKWFVINIDSIDVKNKTVSIYINYTEHKEETTEKTTEKQTTVSTSSSNNSNNNYQAYDNEEQQNTTEYVLNTSTKKVHRPSCRSVKKISPENYSTISSLEDAYAQGYEACKICKP